MSIADARSQFATFLFSRSAAEILCAHVLKAIACTPSPRWCQEWRKMCILLCAARVLACGGHRSPKPASTSISQPATVFQAIVMGEALRLQDPGFPSSGCITNLGPSALQHIVALLLPSRPEMSQICCSTLESDARSHDPGHARTQIDRPRADHR